MKKICPKARLGWCRARVGLRQCVAVGPDGRAAPPTPSQFRVGFGQGRPSLRPGRALERRGRNLGAVRGWLRVLMQQPRIGGRCPARGRARPRLCFGSVRFGEAASIYCIFSYVHLVANRSAILTDVPVGPQADLAAAFLQPFRICPQLLHPWSFGSAGHPARPARGRAGPQPLPCRSGGCNGHGPASRDLLGSGRPGSSGDVATGDGGHGSGSGESGLRPLCPHFVESPAQDLFCVGSNCAARPMGASWRKAEVPGWLSAAWVRALSFCSKLALGGPRPPASSPARAPA
jgi:hypothetical protein